MSYKLILDPDYINPNEGEIYDSFLINSDGQILEYARIRDENGVHISTSLAASRVLGDGTEQLRDFVVTPDGTLHAYNGTFNPTLKSYSWQSFPQAETKTYSGWSTVNNVSYGGIDYFENYVFVTDMKTGGSNESEAKGIVRFSQTGEPVTRFAEQGNFIDLTVGLDSLVYGLESYGKISIYDPESLELVRSFTLQDRYNDYRGIAVNQQGEIFAAAWDGNIYYFDPEGKIVDVNEANQSGVIDLNTRNFNDINISLDGKELIAGDRFGLIALLDVKPGRIELQDLFPTGGNSAFVSFGNRNNISLGDSIAEVSIADAEVLEGSEFEPAKLNFTVSLSQAVDEVVEVDVYSFIPWGQEHDSNPQNFADYNDANLTGEIITFAPGETKKVFSVDVFDDWEAENNEQIYVEIGEVFSNNAVIGDRLAIGTIIDDDFMPTVSISDAEVIEGNGFEPAQLNFIVSLSDTFNETVEVDVYAALPWGQESNNLVAADGNDVDMRGELITFAPGETEKIFSLNVFDDGEVESNEQINAEIGYILSENAIIGDRIGIGTIFDDDFKPVVSIQDAEVLEGDLDGSTWMNFSVNLSDAVEQEIEVHVASFIPWDLAENAVLGFASPNDVVETNEILTFAPGETEKIYSVEILGDLDVEADEQINAEIIQVFSDEATIGDRFAVGTILDNDSRKPTISISDAETWEWNWHQDRNQFEFPRLDFTVSLSHAVDEIVEVDLYSFIPWGTEYDNHPEHFADYNDVYMTGEILTFAPGETEKVFSLEVYDDAELENDEQIYVEIGHVLSENAIVGDGLGIGTILDDDFMPVVSISDATMLEGDYDDFDNAPPQMEFIVSLDAAAYRPVAVDVNLADYPLTIIQHPASFGDDFYPMSDGMNLTFEPGETEKAIAVEINPDKEYEPTEQFALEINNVYGATIGKSLAIGTIIDDDFVPTVSIADAEVLEGDGESSWMNFTVNLSAASDALVEVDVQSFMTGWENSTIQTADYNDVVFQGQMLSFAPGETEKTFSVEVLPDFELEADEQIYAEVAYIFSDNAAIDKRPAIGTILDNESRKPQLSITDAVAIEGGVLEFQVELDRPAVKQLTIQTVTTEADYHGEYTTAVADAGSDYWLSSSYLTFEPGETSKTFQVETNEDFDVESDEQLAIEIYPESADVFIKDNLAIGTIADNDLAIGEVGFAQDMSTKIQQIQFQNKYVNPVVIVSPLTRRGGDPAIARITEIQADSFSVFVQEPILLKQKTHSGGHVLEDFSYMVIEAGSWTMPDGSVIEAGLTEVDTNTRSKNWDRLEFGNDFDRSVAISSVQTYNNEELIRLRQRSGDENGIDLALEKEEALLGTSYNAETVGYVALASGDGSLFDGIGYAAGTTGRTVNHRWQQLDEVEDRPYVFASVNSYFGGDSVGLRYQMGSIRLDEDTSRDYEIAHTREDIAYLGFDNLGAIIAEI